MSHTTTIDEIVFTDIEALKQAVVSLNKEGVKASLVPNAVPRAYYGVNQPGMGKADQVLKLEQGQYDVGFYMDKAKGGLIAKADFHAGYISSFLGAKTSKGESAAQGQMGRLYHHYAKAAAMRKAVQQGWNVREVKKADGSVQLVMTGMH